MDPATWIASASSESERFFEIVDSFEALLGMSFKGFRNASCWSRSLKGNFDEIVSCVGNVDEIVTLEEDDLLSMVLSEEGRLARRQLIQDLRMLQEAGLDPSLDIIPAYPKADESSLVPVDVYDFHADSATVPTDTLLCTYSGASSEALPNDQVERYIDDGRIRSELLKRFGGPDGEGFQAYLKERFFDLHYRPLPGAQPVRFGLGNMWRIATECAGSLVRPCIHRAPTTREGDLPRLLLIS